jgi:hypothetical protein
MNDTVKLPASASMRADNAYSLDWCDIREHRPSYMVCANKVEAFKRDGKLGFPDCEKAIGNRSCPALHMREKEIAIDESLYYVKRGALPLPAVDRPMVEPSKFNARATLGTTKKAAAPNTEFKIDAGSYADALNNAIAESSNPLDHDGPDSPDGPPSEGFREGFIREPAPPTPMPSTQGMSLLEIARRNMGKTV